jgi:hypothetical protein
MFHSWEKIETERRCSRREGFWHSRPGASNRGFDSLDIQIVGDKELNGRLSRYPEFARPVATLDGVKHYAGRIFRCWHRADG